MNEIKIELPDEILENWQEIADILAETIEIPAALIMRYVDPVIQVFVSSDNPDNPYRPGDSETLFDSGLYCERVIKTSDKLHVPDALADPEWENNPDLKLNMISYLGFPIRLPDNTPFGTICVLDTKNNEYSDTTEKLMLKFRSLIESHLEILYMNQVLGDKNRRLSDYLTELQALRGFVSICSSCRSIKDEQDNWHPVEQYLTRNPETQFSHGICPECMKKLYPEYADGKRDEKK